MRDLIVIGGGEHARVVIDAARAASNGWRVVGFVDPLPCEETQSRFGTPRLGDDTVVPRHENVELVLGVGSFDVGLHRQNIVARIKAPSARWATIVHPSAVVSPTATLGAGTVVFAGTIVASGARVGEHCILNHNVVVDHDATLGDFIHASPGSIIAGGAAVGDGSYIGMGALVRDHITLGRNCLVGMGAVVTKSFGDGIVLLGVPAKPVERGMVHRNPVDEP
jgi:acetyltransferase EpsM